MENKLCSYRIFAKCIIFLRNQGMNVKIHHFSIRLRVFSRTTVQQKCCAAFLHSWLYTLGGFVSLHKLKQEYPQFLLRFSFTSLFPCSGHPHFICFCPFVTYSVLWFLFPSFLNSDRVAKPKVFQFRYRFNYLDKLASASA